MKAEFWHERWANNQIGFHESQVNPLLVAHFAALDLPKGARVFVPLCGKTLDIDWLLAQGYRVAGAEISPLAISQLFGRLGVTPTIACDSGTERRSAPRMDFFVGDFFSLSAAMLGQVDAVYDRAALIALPPEMRRRYAEHLARITNGALQLLVTLEYDQQQMNGPPFSVPAEEVRGLYRLREPKLLTTHAVAGGIKGRCPGTENVWLLQSARVQQI